MGEGKHKRLIVHIIQNILIHKNLQACRKFFVCFPEPHNYREKGKQIKLASCVVLKSSSDHCTVPEIL